MKTPVKKRRSRLRAYISLGRRNRNVKLGSLTAAIILAWYVQYSKNITRVMNIRVEKPEIPAGLVLSSRIPSFMPVSFRGSSDIIDFNVSAFQIILTNPDPAIGENIYYARLMPELPEEIEGEFKKEIPVLLDRLLVREIPIRPKIVDPEEGNLKRGYLSINPDAVEVRGPFKNLSELQHLDTLPIKLSGPAGLFVKRTGLAELPEFISVVSGKRKEVRVGVRLIETEHIYDNEILFENIPIVCMNEIRGLTMKILGTERVTIRAYSPDPNHKPAGIRPEAKVFCPVFYDETTKTIEPTSLINDVPVRIELSGGNLEILEVQPPTVHLQFEKSLTVIPGAIRKGFKEHVIQ